MSISLSASRATVKEFYQIFVFVHLTLPFCSFPFLAYLELCLVISSFYFSYELFITIIQIVGFQQTFLQISFDRISTFKCSNKHVYLSMFPKQMLSAHRFWVSHPHSHILFTTTDKLIPLNIAFGCPWVRMQLNNKRNVVLYLDKDLVENTRELGFMHALFRIGKNQKILIQG